MKIISDLQNHKEPTKILRYLEIKVLHKHDAITSDTWYSVVGFESYGVGIGYFIIINDSMKLYWVDINEVEVREVTEQC